MRLLDISTIWRNKNYQSALQKIDLPEIDPKNLVIRQLMYFNRGNALLSMDRPDEAREEFVKYRDLANQLGIDVMQQVLLVQKASADGQKDK